MYIPDGNTKEEKEKERRMADVLNRNTPEYQYFNLNKDLFDIDCEVFLRMSDGLYYLVGYVELENSLKGGRKEYMRYNYLSLLSKKLFQLNENMSDVDFSKKRPLLNRKLYWKITYDNAFSFVISYEEALDKGFHSTRSGKKWMNGLKTRQNYLWDVPREYYIIETDNVGQENDKTIQFISNYFSDLSPIKGDGIGYTIEEIGALPPRVSIK